MSAYKIEAGTAQHVGDRPQQNDRTALFAGARAPGYMLAVLADGVSGGALAAEQALQTSKQLFDDFAPGAGAGTERLMGLLREIARETHAIIKMNPTVASMEPASTLVLLLLTPAGEAVWAHVGDSRLYRFTNGQCLMRSGDSAYVEHLVSEERLPVEAAKKHRNAKLLVNLLGNRLKQPFITVGSQQGLRPGDAFLLCSDGLWAYFTDTELAAVVARHSPRRAAELLIDKAGQRAHGKGDNRSMAIIKLVEPPLPA